MSDITWALASGVLHLTVLTVLIGPLIWWRARRCGEPALSADGRRRLGLAAGIYLGAVVVLNLPRLGFFADLAWNWQNKLLLALILVIAVSVWPTVRWSDVGVRRPRAGWWMPVLSVVAGAIGLQLLTGPLDSMTPTAETVAFQALIPGLDEELLFRGLLLLLLDRALAARREMWSSRVGWSALLTSVLFGLGHGLHLREGFEVTLDLGSVIVSTLLGVLLVWLRIRWNSLWPAVLAHNGINSSIVAAQYL